MEKYVPSRGPLSFSTEFLWTRQIVDEVYQAFVKHPDYGEDDFMTKLKMANASSSAKRLMAEMLWALLVFPSNMKARTKALQVRTLWTMSGEELSSNSSLMKDDVLAGVGSGGPGFNNYRPSELAFLIELTRDLKEKSIPERRRILTNYEVFIEWIDTIPRAGSRQYRHMLRFFCFPDRVERISSNNDRRKILGAFSIAPVSETRNWTDRQLDDALLKLRGRLEKDYQGEPFDFYISAVSDKWAQDRRVKTPDGEVTVVVPGDEEEEEEAPSRKSDPEIAGGASVHSNTSQIG